MKHSPLRYWFWWPARTLDTFEADTPPVMQVARNIYAPLISDGLDGKFQGMIAEDWQVDDTGRTWRFRIRKGLTFDDGTPITPDVVIQNFRRILWLTRSEKLALNSLMPEVAAWRKYADPLASLSLENDSVVFRFNRRPINLFEAISQPLYGIADPKCFDENGRWKDPFCHSPSGQYRMIAHSSGKIVLQSRGIFASLPDAPERIEIYAPIERSDSVVQALLDGRGDLTVEHSFAISRDTLKLIRDKGLKTLEEPPVRMHFLHLNPQHEAFKEAVVRRSVRDMFLRTLKADRRFASSGLELNASFVPKGGVGYADFPLPAEVPPHKGHGESVEVLFFPIAAEKQIQEAIEDSVLKTLKAHGFRPKVSRYQDRFEPFNRMRKGDFDVIVRGTGIFVNNPYADLRMMFMSKVGAMIPDPSGSIPAKIEAAEMEADPERRAEIVKEINRSMFDDAAIITFAHSNLIYISRKGADLSKLNLFSDPIEFRSIGWN